MIRIFKFKKNDLNPSAGKQIEYSVSDIRDFFHFSTDEVTVHFRYISHIEGDYLNGLKFTSTFKLSPARGDYKCYGNPDGSINLKNFFLDLSKKKNTLFSRPLSKTLSTNAIQSAVITGEKTEKTFPKIPKKPLRF